MATTAKLNEQVNGVRRALLNLALNESNQAKQPCSVVIALNTPILRSGRRGHVVKGEERLGGKYSSLFSFAAARKTPVPKCVSSKENKVVKIETSSCETKAQPLEAFHLNPKQRERKERHKAFEFLNSYANTFKALRHTTKKIDSRNTNKESASTKSDSTTDLSKLLTNTTSQRAQSPSKQRKTIEPKKRRHTAPNAGPRNAHTDLLEAIAKLALEPIIKE